MTKQIICMKWGTRYGSEYVNKLYQMVRHFTDGDIRFVCLTDDKSGIREEVECYDCPMLDAPKDFNNAGWRKVTLFRDSDGLFGLEGRWLFLDLDIMITDSINELWDYETDKSFVVMVNATQKEKNIGNTSCYRFDIGKHTYIHDNLIKDDPYKLLPDYPNSQTYISRRIKELTFFPEAWCLLFKAHCIPSWPLRFFKAPRLPAGAKVVAFPGLPNPPEAALGIWKVKKWHKKFYKYIRPTTWITDIWKLCEQV